MTEHLSSWLSLLAARHRGAAAYLGFHFEAI